MTSRWSNPTGGLGYHLRASRHRDTTWAPFTQRLARWLAQWDPPESELVLVGPSGGACLDTALLARFARLVAVDIDPFAPWFFRRRARAVLRSGATTLTWDSRDYLSPGAQGFALEPFRGLLAAHPGAAVLFCNVLGQLPLLGPDRDPEHDDGAPPEGSFERWLHELPQCLEGRSWASFHDRLSGTARPLSLNEEALAPWATSEELVLQHYAPREGEEPDGEELELVDHRTSALLVGVPRRQFVWELLPGLFHFIEAMAFSSRAQ